MTNKHTALLAGLLAATKVEQERNEFYEFTNPYAGLDGLTYTGSINRVYKKNPLNKKQKNARAASKASRKARRKQRK